MKNSTFATWLDTLISEKGIDTERTFEFTDANGFNLMPYGVVIEAAKTASASEQSKIKNILVMIDFKNGDICHFLRHLGQGLAANAGRA